MAIKYISILLFISLLFIGQASAYNVSASTNFDKQFAGIGETFNALMYVNPYGNEIAGIQSNFNFNPSIIRINYISEGAFMSDNGKYQTFFNEGTIDNVNGTIVNTFDAIIGRHNTSNPGKFIIFNITTIGYGSTTIVSSNIKIASPEGMYVPVGGVMIFPIRVTHFGSISGGVNIR